MEAENKYYKIKKSGCHPGLWLITIKNTRPEMFFPLHASVKVIEEIFNVGFPTLDQ